MLQYNACVAGAEDIQRDRVATAVQGAYYAAYWNNAKRPLPLAKVLHNILDAKEDKGKKPDIDVKAFEEKYRRFAERGGFKKRN